MNNEMYNKYKDVELTEPLVNMYAELIAKDEITKKVFVYIGKRTELARLNTSNSKIGATISGITTDIQTFRNVKVKNSNKFKKVQAPMERKHVERVVTSLLLTGLCYYEEVGKTKVIYCTKRGIQVLRYGKTT